MSSTQRATPFEALARTCSTLDRREDRVRQPVNGGRWIEATWRADDGTLYGWYHTSPAGLCPGTNLTAPKIGALRSTDNGLHWKDLGIVMEARPNTLKCDAQNGYFAGGHGDFCVMLDQQQNIFSCSTATTRVT